MKKLELTNTESEFIRKLILRYFEAKEDFGLVDDYPLEPHNILDKLSDNPSIREKYPQTFKNTDHGNKH